jgi:hypothetical protein
MLQSVANCFKRGLTAETVADRSQIVALRPQEKLRERLSGYTGLHGPPSAGFAVFGLRCLLRIARRDAGNRAARLRSANLSLIRVEPNFRGSGMRALCQPVSLTGIRRGLRLAGFELARRFPSTERMALFRQPFDFHWLQP